MRAVIVGAAVAAATVAGGVSAVADSGDGLEACNQYEICFAKDADTDCSLDEQCRRTRPAPAESRSG